MPLAVHSSDVSASFHVNLMSKNYVFQSNSFRNDVKEWNMKEKHQNGKNRNEKKKQRKANKRQGDTENRNQKKKKIKSKKWVEKVNSYRVK